MSAERAKQIVDKAAKEANDVLQCTQADPLKKPNQVEAAVKQAVSTLVESGDPAQVVQYIKNNGKEFPNGVYKSWFMKVIRAQLDAGPQSSAAAASETMSAGAALDRGRAAEELRRQEEGERERRRQAEERAREMLASNPVYRNLCCPISLELMRDPVVCTDGHTYERVSIVRCFQSQGQPRSPQTNAELESNTLVPNHALRGQINSLVQDTVQAAVSVEEAESREGPEHGRAARTGAGSR